MKARIKRNLAGGIIVLAPIAVTAFVVLWIYNRIIAIVPSRLDKLLAITSYPTINQLIRLAVVVTIIVVLLFVIGLVVRTTLGVILQRWLDELANRIPGLRMVYNATQLAIETLLGGTSEFQTPVKVEVKGMRFTAFKTGNRTEDGREIIFLPTAPNITTGFVIEIEPERVEETEENVEEALTRILSAGFGDKKSRTLVEDLDDFVEDESSSDSQEM